MSFAFDPEFTVSVALDAPTATVVVSGELDLATAPKLARGLEALPLEATDIRLSLSGVWFADINAIGRLARGQHRLAQQRRTMVITDVSDEVLRVIRLSGLVDEFEIADDVPPAFLEVT